MAASFISVQPILKIIRLYGFYNCKFLNLYERGKYK